MTQLFRIYMDDSGNVDAGATNDPNQRYGSVTAVILDAEYLDATFNPMFDALSIRHFGATPDGKPHNIHRRLLSKPPDHGQFSVLNDDGKRAAWDADCIEMMNDSAYTVISACVDKVRWYWQYPHWRGDFYEVLVQSILERSFYYLRNRGMAEVNLETKNPGRDQRIKEHFRKGLESGFQYINAKKLQGVFTSKEMNITLKSEAKPGAQLADLLAAPALQHIRALHTKRHLVIGSFVSSVCDILEKKKFYRLSAYGPVEGKATEAGRVP
jgi:hypothetical protein